MYRSNRGTRALGRTVLSALAVVVLGVVVASPVGAAPAKVLQKAGVLRLTDFPADWKAEKSTSDAPPKLAGCAAIAKVGKTLRKTSTKSPDFTTGTLTRAHNSVVVVASPKVATTDFKPYEGNALTDCFKPAAEKAFRDPSIDSLVVTTPPSGLTAPGADQSVSTEIVIAATIAATASQPAQRTVIVLDTLIARVGSTLVNYSFINFDVPLPIANQLIATSMGRLVAAGA